MYGEILCNRELAVQLTFYIEASTCITLLPLYLRHNMPSYPVLNYGGPNHITNYLGHLRHLKLSCLHFSTRPLLQLVGTFSNHSSLHLHLRTCCQQGLHSRLKQPPRVKSYARESTPESLSLPKKYATESSFSMW